MPINIDILGRVGWSKSRYKQCCEAKIILRPETGAEIKGMAEISCFFHLFLIFLNRDSSVAELQLFRVAPAPDGQGPRADSDLLMSAPAPGKKGSSIHYKFSC